MTNAGAGLEDGPHLGLHDPHPNVIHEFCLGRGSQYATAFDKVRLRSSLKMCSPEEFKQRHQSGQPRPPATLLDLFEQVVRRTWALETNSRDQAASRDKAAALR